MTIPANISQTTLLGNGVTTIFTLPSTFVLDAASDVVVSYTNVAGVPVTLSPTLYTISIPAAPAGGLWGLGGTLTYPLSGSPISTNTYLTVQRILPLQQNTSFVDQGNVWPSAVEIACDTLEMQIQQVNAETAKAIQAPAVDPTSINTTLPAAAARANMYCAFDANGNVIATPGAATGTTVSAAMVPVVQAATTALARTAMGIGGVIYEGGTSTGSANAQVVTLTPTGYTNAVGNFFTFIAGFTNTASMTINLAATGAQQLYKYNSVSHTSLSANDIVAGNFYIGFYDGTIAVLLNPASSTVTQLSIAGCLISAIAGNKTTATLTVASGQAADSTGALYITSAGYSWAASNGNAINGTDAAAATLANSTTYHVFLCAGGSGTGTFVSASLTPTLPGGYNSFSRRIGSFVTTNTGSPIPYASDEISGGASLNYLTTQTQDIATGAQATARITYALNVPSGIKVQAIIRACCSSVATVLFTSGDQTDVAPGVFNAAPAYDATGNGVTNFFVTPFLTTDTTGSIGARASTGGVSITATTLGWMDWRRS